MLEIYTDGACLNNGQPNAKASWAFVVLKNKEKIYEESGLCVGDKQTNNVGELRAIWFALQYCYETGVDEVLIYSDSKYAINSCTIWSPDRKRKNNKEIKNLELIKKIWSFKDVMDIDFEWVRGHNEDWYNDMADQLANGLLYERD
jgi:ribonuclease HI